MVYTSSAELYHHGIKGQKWGVRRFQNPDGSLTAAGQRRYSALEEKKERKTLKANARLEKEIGRVEKARGKTNAAREKNYKKLNERLDRKVSSGKATRLYADYRKEDFDLGTKAINLGYDRYAKTIRDYKSMKISSINDPSIKKTEAYKAAGKAYKKQIFSDARYGSMPMTILMYAGEAVDEVEGRK